MLSKIASSGRLVPVGQSVLKTPHLSLLGSLSLACVKSIKCGLLSVRSRGLASCTAVNVLWVRSICDETSYSWEMGNCHVDLILLSRHLESHSCDPLLVLQGFIVSPVQN